MTIRSSIPALFLVCSGWFSVPCHGAIVAQFNFENGTADAQVTSETQDAPATPFLTVSDLTRGIAATFFQKDNSQTRIVTGSVDDEVWYITGGNTTNPANFNTATNNYLTFTLTPDVGAELTLNELAVRIGIGKTGTISGHGLTLRLYNESNLATEIDSVAITGLTDASVPDGPIWADETIDLSSLGTITAPITFRMYFTDTGSGASNKFGMLDTLTIDATAVPEPSTWALASLGLLPALIVLRRRRRA